MSLLDCSLPPDRVRWNETYHVIGAPCNNLVIVGRNFDGPGPTVIAGRDPICDILPDDVESKQNLDEPFDVKYLERHGFSAAEAQRLIHP